MATRVALPARIPIGRVKVGGETLMVYATEDWSRALRVIVESVNAVEAGIAAVEVSNSPSGSISATTVQAALNELDTEKQPKDATLTAVAGVTTAADKLIYWTGVDTAAATNFSAYARNLVDDPDAGTARGTLGLGTIATQAASSVAITGGAVDGTTIGATTPSTGKFTSVESTGYVKSASTTVAGLPSAVTVGAGARHFVTDANSTTFLAAAVGGGANAVPVVSDGAGWVIG